MAGGQAGQGIQTIGSVLSRTMARGGLEVFADQDYESRIRGGHNFFRVRARDEEVRAPAEEIDILIALNRETMELHRGRMKRHGLAIFDREKTKIEDSGDSFLDIPLEKLAVETASERLMSNSVAMGAAIGLLGYDFELLAGVLRDEFGGAGAEMAERNVAAARVGFDQTVKRERRPGFPRIKPVSRPGKMLMNGSDAVALGAMAAGCKFVAGYPMTPTTSILELLAAKGMKYDIAVVQPEDEIAAINMVIGAAFAGVRAMTATSGGGFCLMTEGLSLAGMTETPIVVVLGQRPGPAIGLPTRTEQGELLFALHAGHGEFPRGVLAPMTVEDCFHLTVKAFNIADKYQTPVILITDTHLATSYNTVDRFDLSQVKIERGQLLSDEEVSKLTEYKRHRITESGISPRALPMQGKVLVVTDSDEHNEEGHIIEDAETRRQMVSKRMRKLEGMRADITAPRLHEQPGAEATLVGWGSTYGAIREAASILRGDGVPVNVLQLNELWPFPAGAVREALGKARRCVVVENNATSQLSHLMQAETGIKASGSILKFDGRPFAPAYIAQQLKEAVQP